MVSCVIVKIFQVLLLPKKRRDYEGLVKLNDFDGVISAVNSILT